jgi:hypothetical protein
MYIQSAQDTTTTRTSANFFPAGEEWKASAVCRLPSTFSALPAFYSRPANTPQQHCTALHCTAQHKSTQLNSERASERQAGISPASRAAGRAAAGTQAHRQAGTQAGRHPSGSRLTSERGNARDNTLDLLLHLTSPPSSSASRPPPTALLESAPHRIVVIFGLLRWAALLAASFLASAAVGIHPLRLLDGAW